MDLGKYFKLSLTINALYTLWSISRFLNTLFNAISLVLTMRIYTCTGKIQMLLCFVHSQTSENSWKQMKSDMCLKQITWWLFASSVTWIQLNGKIYDTPFARMKLGWRCSLTKLHARHWKIPNTGRYSLCFWQQQLSLIPEKQKWRHYSQNSRNSQKWGYWVVKLMRSFFQGKAWWIMLSYHP